MKPLFVLLSVFVLSLLVIRFLNINFDIKLAGKIAISAMLIFTALGHFKFTKGMSLMIPDYFPNSYSSRQYFFLDKAPEL